MRAEVSAFIQYLRNDGVIDDAAPLYAVGDSLAKPSKQGPGLAWSYRTGRVTLRLEPQGIEWPEHPTALTCTLEASVSGIVTDGAKPQAALFDWEIRTSELQLEFAAESKVLGSGWRQHWHFDTHREDPKKPDKKDRRERPGEEDKKLPNEAHPLFHLSFGGDAMKARRLVETGCWGKCLELKAPRLVHPPMDIVLALDFILSNAAGTKWRKSFLKDKSYRTWVGNAQRRFWRPYQVSLADFFSCPRLEQDQHLARLLVPTLHVAEF